MDIRRIDTDKLVMPNILQPRQVEAPLVKPTVATQQSEDLANERRPGDHQPSGKRKHALHTPEGDIVEEETQTLAATAVYTPDGHLATLDVQELHHSLDTEA